MKKCPNCGAPRRGSACAYCESTPDRPKKPKKSPERLASDLLAHLEKPLRIEKLETYTAHHFSSKKERDWIEDLLLETVSRRRQIAIYFCIIVVTLIILCGLLDFSKGEGARRAEDVPTGNMGSGVDFIWSYREVKRKKLEDPRPMSTPQVLKIVEEEWPEPRPKSVLDLIYYLRRKSGEPVEQ